MWINSVFQPLVGSDSNSLKAMERSVPVPCALPSLAFVPLSHRLSLSCLCLKPAFSTVGRTENCWSVTCPSWGGKGAAFAVGWGRERSWILGVIVRENQHQPVADGEWEHHLTVARARHFGNVSYRQSHAWENSSHSLFPWQGSRWSGFPFLFPLFSTTSQPAVCFHWVLQYHKQEPLGNSEQVNEFSPLKAATSTHLSLFQRCTWNYTGSPTGQAQGALQEVKLRTEGALCKCV